VFILIIVVLPIGLYFYGSSKFTEKAAILINWDIRIPDDYEEVFHTSNKSFQGEGERYTIYRVSQNSTFFTDYEDIYDIEIVMFVHDVISRLDVPAELLPDIKAFDAWKKVERHDGSTLVILYHSERQRLYFVQDIR
jgi:hypothetical protein